MITLEQIMLLESRVQNAVEKINQLHRENNALRQKLGTYETRIGEMEVIISRFRDDQGRIEQGILNALNQLDALEDTVDRVQTIEDQVALASEDAPVESGNQDEPAEEELLPPDSLFSGEYIREDDEVEEEEPFVLNDRSADPSAGSFGEPDGGARKETELDIF